MKTRKVLVAVFASIIFASVAIYTFRENEKEDQAASQEVRRLEEVAKTELSELRSLYSEREKLVAKLAPKSNLDKKLEESVSLADFDARQNRVTNIIVELLPHLKPERLAEIKKIEEKINFKRKDFHGHAFEMNQLITKRKLAIDQMEVFPAEKLVYQSQK